jgi:hypothetical protein
MSQNSEQSRPYLCTLCGFRTFKWPNKHDCLKKWPETNEEWDAKEKAEVENDPDMKGHIDRMNKKYEKGV